MVAGRIISRQVHGQIQPHKEAKRYEALGLGQSIWWRRAVRHSLATLPDPKHGSFTKGQLFSLLPI